MTKQLFEVLEMLCVATAESIRLHESIVKAFSEKSESDSNPKKRKERKTNRKL